MITRREILEYVLSEYYDKSPKKASLASGYTMTQISSWLSGARSPQKATIRYLIQCALVPEFRVIAEYAEFDQHKSVQMQLKSILGDHGQECGIYAFYDALGNLIYLGKATILLDEVASAINRQIHIKFPKNIKKAPQKRAEIVKYISAYDVGVVEWSDYPKHVESLILRISKPLLNINIGSLEPALKQPKEA